MKLNEIPVVLMTDMSFTELKLLTKAKIKISNKSGEKIGYGVINDTLLF